MSPLDEILGAEREFAIGIRLLTPTDRDLLRARIQSRWGNRKRWLWESLSDCESVQSTDGWEWIAGFVGARPCVLFFDADEEPEMVAVPSGVALYELLANSYHFEFYVTDRETSYLICFNHHDMLICCGSAREWLRGLDVNP